MNQRIDQVLKAVSDHFSIPVDLMLSKSRKDPIPLAKKIIVHLLPDESHSTLGRLLGMTHSNIYYHKNDINFLSVTNTIIQNAITEITSKLEEMTIKLRPSQLNSLHEVFEDFLKANPDSITLELICILIDEIKEKCRKKIRTGKENLGLDERQLRGFLIWYHHFGPLYESRHPHGYMTLLDMINQIKPISDATRITIRNTG